jgi:hypothetical protein
VFIEGARQVRDAEKASLERGGRPKSRLVAELLSLYASSYTVDSLVWWFGVAAGEEGTCACALLWHGGTAMQPQ